MLYEGKVDNILNPILRVSAGGQVFMAVDSSGQIWGYNRQLYTTDPSTMSARAILDEIRRRTGITNATGSNPTSVQTIYKSSINGKVRDLS